MADAAAREDEDSNDSQGGWVSWFCNVAGHEFFTEVDEDYIRDNFNLYGLRNRVQYYEHALEMIVMPEAPDEDDLQDVDFLEVYRDAQDLYGLIHARFIISPRGLELMRARFLKATFGVCPRVLCDRQPALPTGTSDELRVSRVKTYCPRCEQLYATKSRYSDVDGAYFGTSFAHIFALTYPNLIPTEPPTPFVPTLFGFRLRRPGTEPESLIDRYNRRDIQDGAKMLENAGLTRLDIEDAKPEDAEKDEKGNPTASTASQKKLLKDDPNQADASTVLGTTWQQRRKPTEEKSDSSTVFNPGRKK